MVQGELAAAAADSLDTGLAILDAQGRLMWANAAWRDPTRSGDSANARSFADLARTARGTAAAAIEHGLRSVIAGDTYSFDLEYEGAAPAGRFTIAARPLRGPRRGAVVLRSSGTSHLLGRTAPRTAHEPPVGLLERLTPRELDVLRLMARGLPNRDIASELQLQYSTVRGYVQSLIEKFGANSRLEAVALAYRWGIVT